MKSTKRQRWIKFHTLTMQTIPHAEFVSEIELRDILLRAQRRLRDGELLQRAPRADARTHVRLLDIHFTEGETHAVLLFRAIDRDGQDAVYEDFADGALEPHPKSPTQGNRQTAHLAINLQPTLTVAGKKYDAALEVVTGISSGLVRYRLSSVGSKCGRGVGSLDGNRTDVEFRATFTLNAFAQGTIGDQLRRGVLDGFTLEHSFDRKQGFDQWHLTQARKRRIELDVVAKNWRERLSEVMAAAQLRAREEGYEIVKVHYESEEGRPATHSINAAKADALEDVVAKVERISLDEDLHPDLTETCPEMVDKMVQRL